jgi:hypothetical protein
MPNYNLSATRKDGKLRQIAFKLKKDSVSIDFDHSNNNIVLTIAGKVYVVVPEPPPETVVYKDDTGTEHNAVLLKADAASRTDTKDQNVILDGDRKFKVGHCSVETKDDEIYYRGKKYSEGDTVCIGGRTAIIKKTGITNV